MFWLVAREFWDVDTVGHCSEIAKEFGVVLIALLCIC